MTFTLAGFNTVKRELELPANFTASIDVDLSVGALEESITVSGASPVVDVASNQTQQTLKRDMLDAVPTARTIFGTSSTTSTAPIRISSSRTTAWS